MANKHNSKLNSRKRYLQVALNSTLKEAFKVINQLPKSDRIILEAGTPLIKRYGEEGIRKIKTWYEQHLMGITTSLGSDQELVKVSLTGIIGAVIKAAQEQKKTNLKNNLIKKNKQKSDIIEPYVVADLKMMDRGATEVDIAYRGGASAAVALGHSPVESLDTFINSCSERGLDSMIDMMNVDFPLAILRQLKNPPTVVILHRGVDEEHFNKEKQIPLHEIRRIKGNYDILIAIAGGDTIREVQRAMFNDADIAVVWKNFYASSADTANLANQFLDQIK